MFIYTEKDTASHINTQNTNIYPQSTTNTPNYICGCHLFKHLYFSKTRHSKTSTMYAEFYGTTNILSTSTTIIVAGNTMRPSPRSNPIPAPQMRKPTRWSSLLPNNCPYYIFQYFPFRIFPATSAECLLFSWP